jgi:hypothetical protein
VAGVTGVGGTVRLLRVAAFATYDVAVRVLDKAKNRSLQPRLHEWGVRPVETARGCDLFNNSRQTAFQRFTQSQQVNQDSL